MKLCVLINDKNQIPVPEGSNHVRKESIYRPLGGKIEFGELGANTVHCELVDCRFYDPITEKPKYDNPSLYPDGLLAIYKGSL